ncbi:hypothetical protein [Massilia phosphatilytica]
MLSRAACAWCAREGAAAARETADRQLAAVARERAAVSETQHVLRQVFREQLLERGQRPPQRPRSHAGDARPSSSSATARPGRSGAPLPGTGSAPGRPNPQHRAGGGAGAAAVPTVPGRVAERDAHLRAARQAEVRASIPRSPYS